MKTITPGRGVVDVGRGRLPRLTRLLVIAVLVCGGLSWPAAAMARMVVDATTAIVIDGAEPGPLQKASQDLSADFERVFGRPAAIVDTPGPSARTVIRIVFERPEPSGVDRPSGWERLRIQALPAQTSTGPRTIVLTGSDVRGAIYAIYQFSQQFLGVDPLYWWADHAPARQKFVTVPDDFAVTEGPAWRHRGWFLNDEDLLTGWTPGTADGTGIALDTWDHIFEAVLRLKGDMVVPGTWIFPYEPQVAAAGARGLIVTQHHVNTLGLDTYRWPKNTPMSYLSDPKPLEAAWARAASEYPRDTEVLWSVGFRGQNDYPFWQDDPNAPTTDEGRAGIIRSAIDTQIEIVKTLRPNPEIQMNAWREAATFIHEGVLHIPDGVTLIWPDNGHGRLADRGKLAQGQGEYFHTAMYDYMSGHYTEMVPLERIQRELGRAASAGATGWLLVNTSNVRPVLMTTRAVMELAWNPAAWSSADAGRRYLQRWSREEFGARAAPAIERYYQSYFAAPARYGPEEDATAGDNLYHTLARNMLLTLLAGSSGFEFRLHPRVDFEGIDFATIDDLTTKTRDACRAADARWVATRSLALEAKPLVSAGRSDYFQAAILTPVDVHLHLNRMVIALSEMYQSPDASVRVARLAQAIAETEAAEAALHAAEYGKWKGFYTAGDWLVDTARTIALERAYLDQLQGRPVSQNAIERAKDTGFAYVAITAYQGTQTVH
jgi:Glycosyl hydrolase family 115